MKTILFIDDDIGPLQYLVDIFEDKYNVETAESLELALNKLLNQKLPVDLIITDWHLGGDTTAQNLFKVIKDGHDEKTRNIPIIVVSSDEDNKKWVERQGACFFLKPARPNELMQVVIEKIG